jgi:hypothetical protein
MATTFDTLEFAERLKAGGFTEQQARAATEAFAKATSQELATKADLDELRHATKADIDGLRVELYREMRELAWKMGGLLLAQGAAIVALVKLLPGHG